MLFQFYALSDILELNGTPSHQGLMRRQSMALEMLDVATRAYDGVFV